MPLALGLDVPKLILGRTETLSFAPAYLADADDADGSRASILSRCRSRERHICRNDTT